MNNTMEATAFARMLGAYLKSCANFLATAHGVACLGCLPGT